MPSKSTKRETWWTILIFLAIVSVLSAIFHLAIVNLKPTSLYVGPLMWMPAVAAFFTLRIRRRKISSLPWQWGDSTYNRRAFVVPVLYVLVCYLLVWTLGFGGVPNADTLNEWAESTGLEGISDTGLIIIMVLLLGTIGCIRAMSTIVGEEIGWRGFLVWELRKVLPFGGVAITSGIIWSFWHWPIVIYYGGGDPVLQMVDFTVMITAMSVIMTYFTFKSGSMWPAILFHAAHNVYLDKIFDPLTIEGDDTAIWTGEYGLMMPITTSVFAVYFWRKARAEAI